MASSTEGCAWKRPLTYWEVAPRVTAQTTIELRGLPTGTTILASDNCGARPTASTLAERGTACRHGIAGHLEVNRVTCISCYARRRAAMHHNIGAWPAALDVGN